MKTKNDFHDVLNGIIESAQYLEDMADRMSPARYIPKSADEIAPVVSELNKGVMYGFATASLIANWGSLEIMVRRKSTPTFEMMAEALDGLLSLGWKMDKILLPPCSIRSDSQIAEEGTSTTSDEDDWMTYRLAMRRIQEVMEDYRCSLETNEEKIKPKVGKRKYGKTHNLTGPEMWAVAALIREIRGGKRKKGELIPSDKSVRDTVRERANTHPLLSGRTMPSDRTLEGWIAIVREGGDIPGSYR